LFLWAPALCAAGALLWVAAHGVPVFRADMAGGPVLQRVLGCPTASKAWDSNEWLEINDALLAAVLETPLNPVRHDLLARFYACAGVDDWNDPVKRYESFLGARYSLDTSLALRPDHAHAVAARALASFAIGEPPAAVAQQWARALALAPHEKNVQLSMLDLVLRGWSTLTPEMRAWARQQYATKTPAEQAELRAWAQKLGAPDAFP
jgi:hypothetical protein